MKVGIIASIIFWIVVWVLVASTADAKDYTTSNPDGYEMTQVDKVYDGDTFYGWAQTFIYQTTYMKIRIRGIDTPELRGSSACEKILAVQARDYLANLLEKSEYVLLGDLAYDSFGRVLASVDISQGNVSALMIKAGHARPYVKSDDTEWCVSS